MDLSEIVGLVARVFLGLVLLYAGYGKIRSRRWPMLAREAGTPKPIVIILPAFELMLGLLLVGQLAHDVVAWVGLALFVGFLVVVSLQLRSGKDASCNCFGGDGESTVSRTTVLRNVGFVVVALVGALF